MHKMFAFSCLFPRSVAAVAPVALATIAAFGTKDVSSESASPSPLSPSEFRSFKLVGVQQLTHDTKKYTVAVPGDAGLRIASLVMLQVDVDGKKLARPYTPTSSVRARDSMEFIIKTYPEGKVSRALADLKEGGEVEIKGPFQKYEYTPNKWAAVGLLAGGTGITPMYQLVREVLSDPRDTTRISLLYASRTPEDIILKAELDALAVAHPNFTVTYVVGEAPAGSWDGPKGYITEAQVAASFPSPTLGETIKVMLCGPPGFYKAYSGEKVSVSDQGPLVGLLKQLGYTEGQVFKY